MAEPTIKIKRSAVAGKIPTTTNLSLGELGLNTYDGKVFLKQDQGGVGVGTTVIVINPWNVGLGTTGYNINFTSGSVGIGTTDSQTYQLYVNGDINFTGSLYQNESLLGSLINTTSSTSQVGIHSALSITTYRSVEYLIQAQESTNFQLEKLLVIHDGSNTYNVEYGAVNNGNLVASYDTDISGGNIRLLVTPSSSGITTYKISYTAIRV